jgi:hypothetical protein
MWIFSFLNRFAYRLLDIVIHSAFDGFALNRYALDDRARKAERLARYALLIAIVIPVALAGCLFLIEAYDQIIAHGKVAIGNKQVNPIIGFIYLAAILVLKLIFSVQFFAILLAAWFYRREGFYYSFGVSLAVLALDAFRLTTIIHISGHTHR